MNKGSGSRHSGSGSGSRSASGSRSGSHSGSADHGLSAHTDSDEIDAVIEVVAEQTLADCVWDGTGEDVDGVSMNQICALGLFGKHEDLQGKLQCGDVLRAKRVFLNAVKLHQV